MKIFQFLIIVCSDGHSGYTLGVSKNNHIGCKYQSQNNVSACLFRKDCTLMNSQYIKESMIILFLSKNYIYCKRMYPKRIVERSFCPLLWNSSNCVSRTSF